MSPAVLDWRRYGRLIAARRDSRTVSRVAVEPEYG
jgi:hypothetical protein